MSPLPLRRLWAKWKGSDHVPPVGSVSLGSLRRITPFSREFGYDRGLPIDRYYIEAFLLAHASDIRGHVLEVADDIYTRRFGGDRVSRSDVLHVAAEPAATIIADLTRAEQLPSETFDCVILTQTLQFIFDVPAALRTVERILRPSGVLLATVPGISAISRYDMDRWGCYWAFTSLSVLRLIDGAFGAGNARIETHGNVLTAVAFLYGMAAEELEPSELDARDQDYQLLITIRAEKPSDRKENSRGAPP